MDNKLNHIDPDAVTLQLNKIIQSEKFLSSERFTRFIKHIVNQTLDGNSDKIKAYSIAIEVFDRDENFDPQADPIVRIYAGRLRQALKDYYHTEGKNDPIIITIPKGTYVPIFSENNLPKNEISNATGYQKLFSKKSFIFFIITIIGILISSYYIVNNSNSKHFNDDLGRATIEINLFQNLSSSPENEQFSLRLIEQTEIALGQFSSILIGNNSGENKSNYTMSGTVQQEEDILKITIKLVDNKTSIQVFSKEYHESLNTNAALYIEDVFANKIAVDLADEFGELQKFRLRNAQNNDSELLPHEAIILYYDYLTHMNKVDNEKLIIELEKTVENYDNYAPAWAAITGLYMDKYKHFEGNPIDFEKAKQAIEKAEIINPRSWHVQNHRAVIALAEGNLNEFYEAIDKQLSLNSNSTMVGQVGLWLCLIEDTEKGVPLIEEAKLRNPYYPRFFHFGNALYYLEKGDFENAYNESEKVRMPDLFWDSLFRAGILGKLERFDEAELALEELLKLKPNFQTNGQEIMSRALYSEKYRAILMDGLNDAGLTFN